MNTAVTPQAGTRATKREWLGLAVLALPTLLLSIDVSVLYLALPHLSGELGADSTEQLWILDIYSFMLAGFLVTMGTLGDRIGRRRLLLIGGGAFGVASVCAAYATSPSMLIAARALLGIAGATLMPSTMALIRNMFRDPKQMRTAIGIWFACFMGGMTLGPLVGGALLEHFWWGSAFLLGVPFMVLLLILGPRLLPEYRDQAAGRIDLTSVALSLVAILPVVYGLKAVARTGWEPVPVAAIVVGALAGALFLRRQDALRDPLLDLRLFASRAFAAALGIMLLGGVVMTGITLMATLYLQTVVGLSPLRAGLWLIPQNVAMVVGSMIAPVLANRFRPAHVIAGGLALAGAGLLVQTQVSSTDGLGFLVAGLVLAALGISFPMVLTIGLVLSSAPPEKAGSAASLSETGGEFGVALGIASFGSLAVFIYRTELADTMPGGLPDPVAQEARESVTAAIIASAQAPGSLGVELVDAARVAFTSGLNAVAAVGATIFFALAVLAAGTLRHVPTSDATPANPPTEPAEAVRKVGSPRSEPITSQSGNHTEHPS